MESNTKANPNMEREEMSVFLSPSFSSDTNKRRGQVSERVFPTWKKSDHTHCRAYHLHHRKVYSWHTHTHTQHPSKCSLPCSTPFLESFFLLLHLNARLTSYGREVYGDPKRVSGVDLVIQSCRLFHTWRFEKQLLPREDAWPQMLRRETGKQKSTAWVFKLLTWLKKLDPFELYLSLWT